MKKETLLYINEKRMLSRGDRVIAGVSGGADSVCLLGILRSLKEELDLELRAVHIHHGLRGKEADRDADFTENLCKSLGIPCRVIRVDVNAEAREKGISCEEAGRMARYRILEKEADGWESRDVPVRIAVAHHGDDNAETILHNLFRGSGLKGLGGIPPVRGRIIRPLLWAGREEILACLHEKKIPYVEDTTNLENDYTRNRLRNQIIPLIASEINEKAVKNILRAGEFMGEADGYLERQAGQWLKGKGKGDGRIPATELQEAEDILRGYIVRQALTEAGCPLRDITSGHIEDIIALGKRQTGKKISLPGSFRAERGYDTIFFINEKECGNVKPKETEPMVMRQFSKEAGLQLKREIPKNQYTKWFDYDKIQDTLSVRFRQTGDYITLPDHKRKTVKAFMIDEKIPASMRDSISLLAEGHHVLWIIGYRISEYYKVTEHTTNILEVRLDGGAEGGR